MSNSTINLDLKNKDEQFGAYNEARVLAYLKKKSPYITNDKYKYAILDFYKVKNNQIVKYYEVKARRFSIMFKGIQEDGIAYGANKWIKAKKCIDNGIPVIFYFLMTDGLYRWTLKDYNEQKNEWSFAPFGNKKRNDKLKKGIFIDVKYLELVDKDFCSQEPHELDFLPDSDDEEEPEPKLSSNGFRITKTGAECKYEHKCSYCGISDWYIMPIYGYKDGEDYKCCICEQNDRQKEQVKNDLYRRSIKCKCGKRKQSGYYQCYTCNENKKVGNILKGVRF